MSYTFHIRKNVKWHDGKPLTAEDIRWALTEIIMKYNPNASTSFAPVSSRGSAERLYARHPNEVPLPGVYALGFCDQWIYPKQLYQGTDPRQNERNYKNPVGTGPFMFKEWVRGSHILMERNPNYYKPGQPYVDRVVTKIIPDAAARVVALETGKWITSGIYGYPPQPCRTSRRTKTSRSSRTSNGSTTAGYGTYERAERVPEGEGGAPGTVLRN